jgi:hypothetical protein
VCLKIILAVQEAPTIKRMNEERKNEELEKNNWLIFLEREKNTH